MNPWITLTIIMAAIIFGIDFLLRRKNQFASKYVFRRHLHFFVSIRHAMGKRRKFVFFHKLVYDKVILQTKWKAIYDITKDKRRLEPCYHSFIF
jgi:hypothetical protein